MTTRDRQLVAIAAAHSAATPTASRTSPETTSSTIPTASSSPGSRRQQPRHRHPKGPVMSTTTTATRHARRFAVARISRRRVVSALVAVAAHRARLSRPPATSLISSPDGSIRCRPPSLDGVIAGTGIGAAQWALLRHRGVSVELDRRHRRRLGRRARRRRRARLLQDRHHVAGTSWVRCRDSGSASPKARRSPTPSARSAGARPPPCCGRSDGPSPPPAASTSASNGRSSAPTVPHRRLPAEHHHRSVRARQRTSDRCGTHVVFGTRPQHAELKEVTA